MSGFVAALERLRTATPSRVLVHRLDGMPALDADALWGLHQCYVERLRAAGLGPGQIVLSAIGNTPEFIALLVACRALAMALVPMDPGATAHEILELADRLGASALVSGGSLELSNPSSVLSDGIGLVLRSQRPIPLAADTAVMKLTSGSTGAPKVTATTEAQLGADARHIIDGMRIGPDATQLAVIPLSHSYGFSSLVMPLLLQGTPIVLREVFVPSRLADDARASGACVFPGVPFMFQRLLTESSTITWPPQLQTLISAGAPLPADTARRFLATFGVPIRSFYGTSETGGIAYDNDGDGLGEPGTIGPPLPGVTVTLRPEQGLPPGTGRVFVQSRAISSGYADGAGESFANGYLTGDYGRFDSDGRLVLTGRASSFVNVAGRKVEPAEVEHVLRQLPGVRDVCVISAADAQRGEHVVACVSATQPLTVLAVRRFCARRLAPHKIPRQIVFVDAIPRTSRGKVDAHALGVLMDRRKA